MATGMNLTANALRLAALVFVLAAALGAAADARAQPSTLRVAATTSLVDTGVLPELLRVFEADTGIRTSIEGMPTGRALAAAARGDADLVLVNDAAALAAHLEQHGGAVRPIMRNDFVIAGPGADPAHARSAARAADAFTAIARERADFVSRGDESGTHAAERRIWAEAGVNPKARSGNWYRETGLGMGDTLDIAIRLGAYVFADRGTWLSRPEHDRLPVLFEDPRALRNIYFAVAVRGGGHETAAAAGRLMTWLSGERAAEAIARFRFGDDQPFRAAGDGTTER